MVQAYVLGVELITVGRRLVDLGDGSLLDSASVA
jgi:hypothetical protein